MYSASYLKALLDPTARPLSREEFERLQRGPEPAIPWSQDYRWPLMRPAPSPIQPLQHCLPESSRPLLGHPDFHSVLPLELPRHTIDDGPLPAPPGPTRLHSGPYVVREAAGENCGIIRTLGGLHHAKWDNPVTSRRLRVCVSSIILGQLASTVEVVPEPFSTDDQPWSWVIFDFLENSVRPARYSLAQPPGVPSFMRFWQVEGSNDNVRWDTLSRHNQDSSLDLRRRFFVWELCPQKFYRYIRLVLDPRGTSEGTSTLALTSFELYGEISSPPALEGPPLVLEEPPTTTSEPIAKASTLPPQPEASKGEKPRRSHRRHEKHRAERHRRADRTSSPSDPEPASDRDQVESRSHRHRRHSAKAKADRRHASSDRSAKRARRRSQSPSSSSPDPLAQHVVPPKHTRDREEPS